MEEIAWTDSICAETESSDFKRKLCHGTEPKPNRLLVQVRTRAAVIPPRDRAGTFATCTLRVIG